MYLLCRIGFILALTLFSVASSSFSDEIVKRLDLTDALNVTSDYALIDLGVDKLWIEFRELAPKKKGELFLLKRQFAYFINATAAEREDALSGSPPAKFDLINAKFMQFRKIAQREFPNLNATEKARVKNAEGFMQDKIVAHLQDVIDSAREWNTGLTQMLGTTEEEKRESIEQSKSRMIDLWHENDPLHSRYPFLQARVSFQRRAAMLFVKRKNETRSAAFELVRKGYMAILEFTSAHELSETIVDKLSELYPDDLAQRDETRNKLLKLQVAWRITTEKSVRKKVLTRFEDEFLEFLVNQDRLLSIAYEAFEKLTKWQKSTVLRGSKRALRRRMIKVIVLDHLEAKMASYERRGLTEEQRKEEISQKDAELKEAWSSDAKLAAILPDTLTEKWMKEVQQKKSKIRVDKEKGMMDEMGKRMEEETVGNSEIREEVKQEKKSKSRVDREKSLSDQLKEMEARAMNAMNREEL